MDTANEAALEEDRYDDGLARERFYASSGAEIAHSLECLRDGIAVGQRYQMLPDAPDGDMYVDTLRISELTVVGFTYHGAAIMRLPDGHCTPIGTSVLLENFATSDPAVPHRSASILAPLFDLEHAGTEAAFFLDVLREWIETDGDASQLRLLDAIAPTYRALAEHMAGLEVRSALHGVLAQFCAAGPAKPRRRAVAEMLEYVRVVQRRVRVALDRERTERGEAVTAPVERRFTEAISLLTRSLELFVERTKALG